MDYEKNTPGAPTSGKYLIGDTVTDSQGRLWQCVVSGFPGEWVAVVDIAGSGVATSLTGDVALNNTGLFFDGPSVIVGSGSYFASGHLTLYAGGAPSVFLAKLWDGTTVIAATRITCPLSDELYTFSLSGFFTDPAGGIRISVKCTSDVDSLIRCDIIGVGLNQGTLMSVISL